MTGDIGESMIVRFEGKSRVKGNTKKFNQSQITNHKYPISTRRFITDSRSYVGAETDSDHKLVKMNMKIEWTKLEKEGKTAGHIDTNGFADTSKRAKYKQLVESATNTDDAS